jgi:cytochrome c oxidase subunit I+III
MHITGLRGMPRRVFTYPADIGLDLLNLTSTIGAFILAAGIGVIFWDLVRPKGRQPYAPRNPWNAGTLEWLQEMPGKPWGVRSIPEVDSRYPLWDQPDFERDVDEGRFYLPDAEELKRETIVTSVIDAKPDGCVRLPGPSWIPLWAAIAVGGFFVLGTFHLWMLALVSLVVGTAVIMYWLWTGTAVIPEKPGKDVGLGLTLPLYMSGPNSPGWWAMFITMLALTTAFASLVFGYYFFWTVHENFPPDPSAGPGAFWPMAGGALILLAWGLTILGRRLNRADHAGGFHLAVFAAIVMAAAGAAALLAGPFVADMDPEQHVYQAIVWLLLIWCAGHAALGILMNGYCMARRMAGRMTAQYDADISNVVLYWHFATVMTVVAVATVAGFPLVA